jgi:hypothetical protein
MSGRAFAGGGRYNAPTTTNFIMTDVQQTILEKKAALADAVSAPLSGLGQRVAEVWNEPDAVDAVLATGIRSIPHCQLVYAWNLDGIEVSSMVRPDAVDKSWRGWDLSQRPYLKNNLPYKGIMLSSVYESVYTHQQCITALQAVSHGGQLLGFIAADFALDDLLRDAKLAVPSQRWQQFRGDPAVRGTVFLQTRAASLLDQHIDAVHDLVYTLMTRHGVFHSKIHYSSGRCSLWLYDDPYNYRLHGVEEIINPDTCLAYALRPYPEKAKTTPAQVRRVLDGFKALRFADETIYLRSSSLNIINGMVGLTFSCDGSHYMSAGEFLEKNLSFWVGTLANRPESAA